MGQRGSLTDGHGGHSGIPRWSAVRGGWGRTGEGAPFTDLRDGKPGLAGLLVSLANLCFQKPVPPKEVCPLKPEDTGISNSPGRWSLRQTTKEEVSSRPGFVLPSVLPLAVLPLFLVLLLILAVLLSLFKRKVHSHPCSGLASEDPSTSVHYWPCPDTLEVLGSRNRGKTSLLQLSSWG